MMRALAAALLVLVACGEDAPTGVDLSRPVVVDLAAPPPAKLSAWNLFAWDPAAGFTFNATGERIVPYDLTTALFSDYALKSRAIYVPPGATATFDPERVLELPVGSVIVKSFYFPADLRAPAEDLTLVETRLLVRHDDGWHAHPYIWDEAQQDAVLSPAGEVRPITFIDPHGETQTASYLIPQRNQCATCHGYKESETSSTETVPIGIKARYLAHDGQLARMTDLELFDGAPATVEPAYDFRAIETGGVAAIPAADVDEAARTYLDINCAHCHNPNGVQGMTSQLFLDRANQDPFRLGLCKRPGSAGAGNGGLTFDIVPGDPEQSILYFRTSTTQVGAMMPLLGRSTAHTRGVELLHAWIAAMPADDCM